MYLKMIAKTSTLYNRLDFVSVDVKLFHLVYLFIGHPCYARETLKHRPDSAETENNDLNKLTARFAYSFPKFRVLWMICSCIVVIKNVSGLIYVLAALGDYKTYVVMNYLKGNDYGLTRFDCITTNCSMHKLNHALTNGFSTMPVFTICQPQLKPYFNPLIGVHSHGIIVHFIWTYLMSLMGLMLPIFLHYRPQSSDLLMFVAAPNSYRFRLISKVELLVSQISLSQVNYLKILLDKGIIKERGVRLNFSWDQIALGPPEEDPNKERLVLQSSEQETTNFIDDCLPLVKTEWWRLIVARQIFALTCFTLYYCFFIYIGGMIDMQIRMNSLSRQLISLLDMTQKSGCSLWLFGEDKFDMDLIYNAVPSWNLITLVETIVVATPIFTVLSVTSIHLLISLKEISAWVAEVLDQTRVAIGIIECRRANEFEVDVDEKRTQSVSATFSELKELHKKAVETWFGVRFSRQFIRRCLNENKIANDLIVYNLMSSCCSGKRSHVEIMKKILISIRMLNEHVQQSSKDLSFILAYLYIVNYGCIIILVFVNKKFDNANLLPLVFVFGAASLINILTIIASNIQAQSRHLIDLMWSVIANSTHFKDVQTRHLRQLWIRLACSLTQTNGITVNVFGLSLRYASLFELAFLSTSIVMLVFH